MKVSVSGKQFIFPRNCACCGAYPLAHLVLTGPERNRKARTRGWVFEVPVCKACKRHVRLFDLTQLGFLSIVTLSIILGLVVAGSTHNWLLGVDLALFSSAVAAILLIFFVCLLSSEQSKNCCGLGWPVRYLGSNGSCHTFDIRSRFYASDFVLANENKLVNVSVKVAGILKGAGRIKYQVPRRLLRKRQ